MDAMKIGDFLSSLRKARGYTQQAVAEKLNLSNKTISKWESGGGLPDITVLPALAELYGVTVDEVLAGQRLEGETTGTAQIRCRETGAYLLRRSGLVMNLCSLFAVFVIVWELMAKLLYLACTIEHISRAGNPVLLYLHFAAVFALFAGVIVQRYMLAAARDVAPAQTVRVELLHMRQKLIFLLMPLALHLAQNYLGIGGVPLFSVLLSVACAAMVVAWILLAKRHPGLACRGSAALLLLAVVEYGVGFAQAVLRPGGISWDGSGKIYALCATACDLLMLAAGAVQWAAERKRRKQ